MGQVKTRTTLEGGVTSVLGRRRNCELRSKTMKVDFEESQQFEHQTFKVRWSMFEGR